MKIPKRRHPHEKIYEQSRHRPDGADGADREIGPEPAEDGEVRRVVKELKKRDQHDGAVFCERQKP